MGGAPMNLQSMTSRRTAGRTLATRMDFLQRAATTRPGPSGIICSYLEEVVMAVDSGASATVIGGGHQVKAVAATNPRPDIKYEVTDGTHIANMGEKSLGACIDAGPLLKLTAQVTEVNKALLSVSKILRAGNRLVFDSAGSYIEHKPSGEWTPLEERGGIYVLKMWVPREQKSPF